jgi:hypothetical protein
MWDACHGYFVILASVLCAAKDLGELREASRSLRRNVARLARFLTVLRRLHNRRCNRRDFIYNQIISSQRILSVREEL